MKKTLTMVVIVVLFLAVPVRAEMTLNIKLDFFGTPAAGQRKSSVTTSVYLKSMVQRNLHVSFSTEALKAELKKTFNVPKIVLLAEGDLVWKSGGEPSVTQIVQMNGRDFALVLTPLPRPGVVNFKVGVVEENDQKKIRNILLDTEIVLPDGEVAMLGFRDDHDNSCFIAFCVQARHERTSRSVRRLEADHAPRKIKDVRPVYPAEALKKRVQGVVTGTVEIDARGRVRLAEVISGHPMLNEAALAAVRQWEYEPCTADGKAAPVSFPFTVKFILSEKGGAPDAAARLEGSQHPRKVKHVNPVYPGEALDKRIEGIVILEAVIDEKGKVGRLRVLSSTPELLNKAAMEAVKQWEYEPVVQDGKAVPATFTVTVTFSLRQD